MNKHDFTQWINSKRHCNICGDNTKLYLDLTELQYISFSEETIESTEEIFLYLDDKNYLCELFVDCSCYSEGYNLRRKPNNNYSYTLDVVQDDNIFVYDDETYYSVESNDEELFKIEKDSKITSLHEVFRRVKKNIAFM